VDYYVLEKKLVKGIDGNYYLRLEESGNKLDFFDSVRLLAVDHASNVSVGVLSDGKIVTYARAYASSSAVSNDGTYVRYRVNQQDEYAYTFFDGDWMDLRFGRLNVSLGAKLVLRACGGGECTVDVQRYNASCVWETVGSVEPRALLSTSVADLTGFLPDYFGQNDLRLLFSGGNCTVDFVGLDTSADVNVTVHEGELVCVRDSTGINATFNDLQRADGVCAELRKPYTIGLNFRLPPLNGSGLKRDFIFVAKGYYVEECEGTFGMLGGSPAEAIIADWKDWFEKIENCCRTKGWVWADVAGYDFYYFGNNEYWNLMGPGYNMLADGRQSHAQGLIQFMSKTVTCKDAEGHVAELGFDYTERSGFWDTYPGFDGHRQVGASRPINKDAQIPWNMFFYKDKGDDSWSTATVAMNKSALGYAYQPGIFVHNGFSEDPDMDGVANTYDDDWLKGYVAAALAIEEARTFIMLPNLKRIVWTSGFPYHTACFGAAIRAADRGELYDTEEGDYYRYIRLLLTTGAHFERTPGYYMELYGAFYLSAADVKLCRANDVKYVIDEFKSGCELGAKPSIMNDVFWYIVSTTAGFIPHYGVYLGPVLGALPILGEYFQPASEDLWGEEASANGTRINESEEEFDKGKGTIGYFVEVRFYKRAGGLRTYAFNYMMNSWIGWKKSIIDFPCVRFLTNTTQLSFEVDWNI
jgi:hypothetical protein